MFFFYHFFFSVAFDKSRQGCDHKEPRITTARILLNTLGSLLKEVKDRYAQVSEISEYHYNCIIHMRVNHDVSIIRINMTKIEKEFFVYLQEWERILAVSRT